MKTSYALIAAMSRNWVIGRGNDIPWVAKGEQALFKKITSGGTVIMGRKTFDSIGRPLPKRHNIVITRQPRGDADQLDFCGSVEAALELAATIARPIFVIGGGEIYARTINHASAIHLTTIDIDVEGDVYFPTFDEAAFNLVDTQHFETNLKYSYRHYTAKS